MSRFVQQTIFVIVTIIFLCGSYVLYNSRILPPLSHSLNPTDESSITYEMSSRLWFNTSEEIEFSWEVDGIKGVYFDEFGGVIGRDSRTILIDGCVVQSYDLIVDLNNGETVTLTLTPTVTSFFEFVILIALLLTVFILIWLRLFYTLDAINFSIALFVFIFVTLSISFVIPNCTNSDLLSGIQEYPLNLFVNIATMLFILVGFITTLAKPQLIRKFLAFIRSKVHLIPFGLILSVWIGMLYWSGITWLDMSDRFFIYYCIAVYLLAICILLIYIGRITPYLLICGVTSILLICITVPTINANSTTPDATENRRAAYHLAKHNVFSFDQDDTPLVEPSILREPAYPFYLATVLHFYSDLESLTLKCLEKGDTCEPTRLLLNLANIPLYIGLIWIFTAASYLIIRNWWVVIALNAILISVDVLFYRVNLTELPAALFLLVHAFFLYKILLEHESKHQAYLYAIVSGIGLGLLVLTKAVFLYWVIVLGVILTIAYLFKRSDTITLYRAYVVLFIFVALVTVPWVVRNYNKTGELKIAGRGSTVLAVRAEYSFLTWNEYIASFVVFSPSFVSENILPSFDEEDYYRLQRDRSSVIEETYWYIGGFNQGRVAERAQEQFGEISDDTIGSAAFSIIRENWIQHLALTVSLGWRGSFYEIRNIVFPFYDVLQVFLMFVSMPSLFISAIYSIKKRRWGLLLFLMPALFSFGIHAATTHYIPRYTAPIVPILFITIGLVIQRILSNLRNVNKKANGI